MPPSQDLDNALLSIDSFGPESLKTLYTLVGVDRIEDTNEANNFFWKYAGQVIVSWMNASEAQREQVCDKLVEKFHGRAQNYNSNITRACNRILGLTSRKYKLSGKVINPEQVTETLMEIYKQNLEIDEDVEIEGMFPGLLDNPTSVDEQ
ncbi:MAG: hypothetical protein ABIM99_02310 [Candidatus Dojkabacteria bacterium]